MSDRFRLEGKIALVTGGSRGIGQALAVALSEAGATVAVASRSRDESAATVDLARHVGGDGTAHECDVTTVDAVRGLVSEVQAAHGRVDIVINNAGMNVQQKVVDVTEDAWDSIMATNLKGAFFLAQAAGKLMIDQRSGRIINVASTFAVLGYPGRSVYAASKGALLQVTRTMALEWASYGITVNAVGPTAIRSRMNESVLSDPDYADEVLRRIPVGRFAEPDDVCGAVLFLASSAASMVTGQLLLVDGGWSAI